MINSKASAIITAGGKSSRMNGNDKLFIEIGGVPVIMRACLAFEHADSVNEIIIAARSESAAQIRRLCEEYNITKLKAITGGGANRQESVLKAIKEVGKDIEIIAVHDGARPFIKSADINKIIDLTQHKSAVIPAVKIKETVKHAQNDIIISTPDREELFIAQTPQVFNFKMYKKAAEAADKDYTDDASMLEAAGFEVFITEGDYKNIKITTPDDLYIMSEIRIGTGYDVHKFAKNRKLILCGVEIPHTEGLYGHSDADVAIHALMDALLGSLALGDIGKYFPDNEDEFKNISSIKLLQRVIAIVNEKNYEPSNIDITIIAEQPKLAPYIMQMRENTAKICNIPLSAVSVKATTEEGLGLAGKGIGASAACIVKNKIH